MRRVLAALVVLAAFSVLVLVAVALPRPDGAASGAATTTTAPMPQDKAPHLPPGPKTTVTQIHDTAPQSVPVNTQIPTSAVVLAKLNAKVVPTTPGFEQAQAIQPDGGTSSPPGSPSWYICLGIGFPDATATQWFVDDTFGPLLRFHQAIWCFGTDPVIYEIRMDPYWHAPPGHDSEYLRGTAQDHVGGGINFVDDLQPITYWGCWPKTGPMPFNLFDNTFVLDTVTFDDPGGQVDNRIYGGPSKPCANPTQK